MAEKPNDDISDTTRDRTLSESSQLTPEVAREIAEDVAKKLCEKKNVNIVIAGKTGVGKSTLVGSLLPNQRKRVSVKDGPVPSDSYFLKEFPGIIGDTTVSVYDTRGFCSTITSKNDARRLADRLREEFSGESKKKLDLVIFCQEMFGRFDEASLTSLTFFGGLVKPDKWNQCIVALTKANMLPPPIEEAEDPAEAMIAIQKAMKKEMQEKYFKPKGLLKASEEISFVPVGCKTEKTNKSKIPCCEDSIENLAQECIRRCSEDSALVLASAFSREKIALVAGVVGTTAAGGGIGALVGGLLTFYVGGIGIVPGALIGAGIGAASAPTAIGAKAAIQGITERIGRAVEEKYAAFKNKQN